MGIYSAGQVVFLPFPFSDLTGNKLRPVLLIANVGDRDWIACQITSNPYRDSSAIPVAGADFASGGLPHLSYVRPGKLFTAHELLFAADSGVLQLRVFRHVCEAVNAIIRSGIHG